MKLVQAVTIANMLLSHGNVWTLTIQRDEEKKDMFHLEIGDVYLDADDLNRLLEYQGADRVGDPRVTPPAGTPAAKLSVEYMEGKFYVKDSEPLPDKRKEDKYH